MQDPKVNTNDSGIYAPEWNGGEGAECAEELMDDGSLDLIAASEMS